MSLDFHARLTADGKQAVQEIKVTAKEVIGLTDAVDHLGTKGRESSAEMMALRKELASNKAQLTSLQGDYAKVTKQVDMMGRELDELKAKGAKLPKVYNTAAGSVGNLTSQFNDIGVMLMAGQNPLQLAIQQGTQIGQVFQQSGAKGKDAARLILSGFTAMLSPVNLITIGSIAAGAAMTQWLMGSSKDAETTTDALERLSGRITDIKTDAALSASAVKKEFGGISPALAQMLSEVRDRGLTAIQADATKAAKALIDEVGGAALEISREARRAGDLSGRDAIQNSLNDLFQADTLDDQVRSIERLKSTVSEVALGLEGVTGKQVAFRDAILDTERALRKGQQAENAVVDVLREGWTAALERVRAYGAERLKITSSAQDMLATMQQQNELRRIALHYGEQSVQYTEAQNAAQMRALEQILQSSDASEDLKEAIRQAKEEGFLLAGLDIASGIWGAASAASQLAANLSQAAAQKAALGSATDANARAARSQIMLDTVGDPVGRAGALAADDFQRSLDDGGYGMIASGRIGQLKDMEDDVRDAAENAATLEQAARDADAEYTKLQRTLGGSGGARGGGGKTPQSAKDARQVADYIDQLRLETELMQELDPVQKEMIRNRDLLSKATAAQRVEIQSLITDTSRLEEAQQSVDATRDLTGSVMTDLFDGMRSGSDGVVGALSRIEDKLWDIALQAVIFGQGPLGRIFGGGLMGLLPFKDGGEMPAFAGGGMNYGKGGGRDDRNLALISAGEFTVNAEATAKHRGLLEALNSGAPLPGFAAGGMMGGAASAASGWSAAPSFVINNNTVAPVEAHDDGMDSKGRRAIRFEMADAVGQGMSVRGGGASRQMRQLGLGQKGPRR